MPENDRQSLRRTQKIAHQNQLSSLKKSTELINMCQCHAQKKLTLHISLIQERAALWECWTVNFSITEFSIHVLLSCISHSWSNKHSWFVIAWGKINAWVKIKDQIIKHDWEHCYLKSLMLLRTRNAYRKLLFLDLIFTKMPFTDFNSLYIKRQQGDINFLWY